MEAELRLPDTRKWKRSAWGRVVRRFLRVYLARCEPQGESIHINSSQNLKFKIKNKQINYAFKNDDRLKEGEIIS